MDLDFVSVHKHAKKELGQYPAILTSHLVNNAYVYVIAFARGQLRINFTSIFKFFTKLPESRSDEGNLENFENTSEINP